MTTYIGLENKIKLYNNENILTNGTPVNLANFSYEANSFAILLLAKDSPVSDTKSDTGLPRFSLN